MKILYVLSDLILPLLIFYIVGMGLLMRRNLYDDFLSGAKSGLKTVVSILPTLLGLMVAVGVLRSSGFLEMLGGLLGKALSGIGLPADLVPLAVVRLFSNSAATGLLLDIYREWGADSFLGRAASVMMSCTETVFYTMSVYFSAAKVTKMRYTLLGALLAMGAGVGMSILLAGVM